MIKKINETLSPGIRVTTLDWLTLAIPSGVLVVTGCFIGYELSSVSAALNCALSLPIIWATMLICTGMKITGKKGYLVIERFGQFRTVLFRGIGWINPLFDKIRIKDGSLKIHQLRLYQDEEKRAKLDFTDGVTAVVSIMASYGVGSAQDFEAQDWDKVSADVVKYTYKYTNPEKRIDALLDNAVRPLLQSMTSDAAQKDTSAECDNAAKAVETPLAEIGVYLPEERALVIEDIDIPDSVIEIREKAKRGEAEALAEQSRLRAPVRTIIAVREELKTAGVNLSDKEVIDMLLTQQGLETIRNTGANVTLVGKDVGGLLNLIGVGKGA